MIIDIPDCQWVSLQNKDRRKSSLWNCKTCGSIKRSKEQPPCQCKTIIVGDRK